MPIRLPDPPGETTLVNQETRGFYSVDPVWYRWFISLMTRVQSSAFVQKQVQLTGQNTSLGLTAIPRDSATAGSYRVTVYAQVTTVATTSSSLTVTISWTSNGAAMSQTTAAMTGNTLSTQLNQVFSINVDQNSAISYSSTYASNLASEMRYSLSVICELVS